MNASQSLVPIRGLVHVRLVDDRGRLRYDEEIPNLVTQVGNAFYADRAAGVAGAAAAVTGIQLGTGTTAPATTGAGAALVTLVANSLVALSGTPTGGPGAGTSRRVTYAATWGAGVATASGIAEAVLVNQAIATQTAAPAAATIARVLITPVVNKAAGDSLTLTWTHDLGA